MNLLKGLTIASSFLIVFSSNSQQISIPKDFGYNFLEVNNVTPEVSSLTTNLFGDSTDYYSGAVSFTQTDIDIPGNFDIPVRLTRRLSSPESWFKEPLEMGTWSVDIPHIRSAFIRYNGDHKDAYWAIGKACTKPLNSNPDFQWRRSNDGRAVTYVASSQQYWNGDSIYIPQHGTTKITQQSLKKSNNKNWKIECLTENSANEGFKVTLTNGHSYYFEQYREVESPKKFKAAPVVDGRQCSRCQPTEKPDPASIEDTYYDSEYYSVFLLATKIMDPYGNWVKYEYSSSGILERIHSSDNREILLTSNGHRIFTATANGKTWRYSYDVNSYPSLNKVTRPDNKAWFFEHDKTSIDSIMRYQNIGEKTQVMTAGYTCVAAREGSFVTITHPEGATGEFEVKEQCHSQTNVPKIRRHDPQRSTGPSSYFIPPGSVLYSLAKKTLNLASGEKYIWQYQYSNNDHAFAGDSFTDAHRLTAQFSSIDSAHLKLSTVINPDSSTVNRYFDRRYKHNQNLLFQEWYGAQGDLLKRESTQYVDGQYPGQTRIISYVDYAATPFEASDLISSTPNKQLTSSIKTELFDSEGNVTTYWNKWLNFNEYDVPQLTEGYNSFSNDKRYVKTEYLHVVGRSLLNLPSKVYVSNSLSFQEPYKETIYKTNTALPEEIKYFGKSALKRFYNDDGTLQNIAYSESARYEKFDNYYRGVARKVTRPCSTLNSCNGANGSTNNTVIGLLEINSDGTTQSITDFNGNKTTYEYNPIGWLTSINYNDPRWTDKTIAYDTVVTDGDGLNSNNIFAGMMRQTITQGNYEQRTYHDSLLRPVLIRERDKSNNDTIKYRRIAYDHENRLVLKTFPSVSSSPTLGIETDYDALGRRIGTKRQSDNSTTNVSYINGNRKKVVDGKGHTTTTTYRAYGSPSYGESTLIQAPDSGDTAIEYNVFGQITSIKQGGITETRLYDDYQQLCKTIRPETGITAMSYNNQRQLAWFAQGTLGSRTSCDLSAVPTNHRVIMSYDNLGKLRSENYPDSSPDKTYHYDNNGNLKRLKAGTTYWDYDYNSQNTIEKEVLKIDGKSFVFDWEYNSLGAIKSLSYPSGLTVNYAPNAFGQSTKANNYVRDVIYYPNGQLKSMTYGNGIKREIALDTTGRIDQISDKKSLSIINHLDPSYDLNDNLKSIYDASDSHAYDITELTYDGLDRLKTANGRWGAGSYHYDNLGNITSRTLNNSTLGYVYDSKNQLHRLTGSHAYRYQYDAQGNVVHNGRYGLSFNRANQLVSAKGINYIYDGYNRRVRQQKPDGNHYSVYSSAGILLYRLAANGKKTNSIYLGTQIVAEDDGVSSTPKPEITMRLTSPVPEYCGIISCSFSPLKSGKSGKPSAHELTWDSRHATSCSGTVEKSRYGRVIDSDSISGTSSFLYRFSYPADGTFYNVTLTCRGIGGEVTKSVNATTSSGNELMPPLNGNEF